MSKFIWPTLYLTFGLEWDSEQIFWHPSVIHSLQLERKLQAIYIATLTYIDSVYIFILRLLYIYDCGTYIVCNYIYVWVERWLITRTVDVRPSGNIKNTHSTEQNIRILKSFFFIYYHILCKSFFFIIYI